MDIILLMLKSILPKMDHKLFFLLFQPIFRYFKTRLQMIWLWLGILKPCQKKILNLLLHQIEVLIQEFPIEFNGSCLKPGNFFS